MGVKELAQAKGFPDTHASMIYADRVAAEDCTEVARLRAAGAVIVGLTTAPEIGIPSYTNSPLHGVTRNPWNPEATPGGSSGGSAAAVASGMFAGVHRQRRWRLDPHPVVVLRPARVQDHVRAHRRRPASRSTPGSPRCYGPMVRSVRDAARYVDVTSGPTLFDPTSLPKPAPFEPLTTSLDAARDRLRGKRVAWSSTPRVRRVRHRRRGARRSRPRSSWSTEAGLELVDLDVEFPKPGRAWGLLSAPNLAAWHYDDAKDQLDDLDLLLRISVEGLPHLRARPPRPGGAAAPGAAERDGRGVRRRRPAAHADDRDDRVRGRGCAERTGQRARRWT